MLQVFVLANVFFRDNFYKESGCFSAFCLLVGIPSPSAILIAGLE